jgi:hypothetical protein
MTKEQALEILASTEAAAFAKLISADPATPEYNYLLNNIGLTRQIAETVKFGDPELYDVPENERKTAKEDELAAEKPVLQGPVDVSKPKPEPIPVPAPVEPPTLTKAEVKTKLLALQDQGLDIAALLEDEGYTKLSEVPAHEYAGLLDLAEARVGK